MLCKNIIFFFASDPLVTKNSKQFHNTSVSVYILHYNHLLLCQLTQSPFTGTDCLFYVVDQVLTARPAWRPPDSKPDDLEKAKKALLNDWNPNDPNVPAALLLYHNKFGQLKNGKLYQNDVEYGLSKSQRKNDNRALNVSGEVMVTKWWHHSVTKVSL